MKSKLLPVLGLFAVLSMAVPSTFAHHSGSLYDRDHPITITGTVTDFQFFNPHVHIVFDVKDDKGVVTSWTAEAGPPRGMFKQGWTRDAVKAGDTVTITGFPYKDGKKIMDILKVEGPGKLVLQYGR